MKHLPIRLIWARDERGAIGRDGSLPWCLPSDMAHFKRETMNSVCIMGRRTVDSLGGRNLPGRPLICMSKNLAFEPPNCVGLERSVSGALMRAGYLNNHFPHLTSISVCGGAQIYDLFWPIAKEIVETIVHTKIARPDTLLPFGVCPTEAGWEVVKQERQPQDERHKYALDFVWWKRKP